jgi:hypothetical protein
MGFPDVYEGSMAILRNMVEGSIAYAPAFAARWTVLFESYNS